MRATPAFSAGWLLVFRRSLGVVLALALFANPVYAVGPGGGPPGGGPVGEVGGGTGEEVGPGPGPGGGIISGGGGEVPIPEIDPGSLLGTLTLVTGGLLILRDRSLRKEVA
jgi:hypothetical protein